MNKQIALLSIRVGYNLFMPSPTTPPAPALTYAAEEGIDEARRIAEAAQQMRWAFDSDEATAGNTVVPERGKREEPPLPPVVLPPGLPLDQIFCGDNLAGLQTLPDGCAGLVITSPPYFQQRDYGGLGAGNETSLAAYLDTLLALFAEFVRVTRTDGSIVFNLGDKYEDSSLLLVPYRFALAATAAFPVRLVNNITWVKQNPTPRQFRRRLVSSTEPFFHFALGNDYFYDIDAFLDDGDAPKRRRPRPLGT